MSNERHEIDRLVDLLDGPPPPPRAPDPVRKLPLYGAGFAGLLLAALALLFALPEHYIGTRGGTHEPEMDLRMVVERDGQAYRVTQGTVYRIGEMMFFSVAASRDCAAGLWVSGPSGQERIAQLEVTTELRKVEQEGGLLAWQFDEPGSYTFALTTDAEGECRPPSCSEVKVEVE